VSGTLVSITLRWLAPSDYGGCPLIGYRLFRDTGAGGSISTEVDNALVANQLNLNEYVVALGGGATGNAGRFYIYAENSEGSAVSNIVSFIIATIPDKPVTPPT
jgi:hypothetical protein